MKEELAAEGHPVHVVIVNISNAESTQNKLVEKTASPLFQDTPEVGAWGMHGGAKDDLFVYGPDRRLVAYLPYGGTVNTNLSTDPGYAAVKGAIYGALGVDPAP